MLGIWLSACIVLPIVFALLILIVQSEWLRTSLVIVGAVLCAVSSIALFSFGPFVSIIPEESLLQPLMTLLDIILMLVIVFVAVKIRHPLCIFLALIQCVALIHLEFFMLDGHHPVALVADSLSIMMVLVISCIGALIAVFGIGYMREHEEHLHLKKTKQDRFFFFIFIFLGAMNALVLFDSLLWIFFFWEITTLCSFALIGHDDTPVAKANATRALWMNMLGGFAFVLGMLFVQKEFGTLSIMELIEFAALSEEARLIATVPLAFLCLSGLTKSAQIPFQSWLCGAMVAPTPISALLHSSTMVKAGVYLLLRLAPSFAGTAIANTLTLIGAFTFLAASVLACGQSNAKKILAYSTIANLGLIVACAGMGSPEAIVAGMLLLFFHALSKALLFLCVGAIEQDIGSRDIEDMWGLSKRMPRTAMITFIGIMTMMLPPFGALMAKWMALQSAAISDAYMLVLVTFIAIGSALTIFFWGRFAGMIIGINLLFVSKNPVTKQRPSIAYSLKILLFLVLLSSFALPLFYNSATSHAFVVLGIPPSNEVDIAFFGRILGIYGIYPLFIFLGLGVWLARKGAKRAADKQYALPYMSGIQQVDEQRFGFQGPIGQSFVPVRQGNYYLNTWFDEESLTKPLNIIGIVLIVILIGGLL